jgi:hypothetical protein
MASPGFQMFPILLPQLKLSHFWIEYIIGTYIAKKHFGLYHLRRNKDSKLGLEPMGIFGLKLYFALPRSDTCKETPFKTGASGRDWTGDRRFTKAHKGWFRLRGKSSRAFNFRGLAASPTSIKWHSDAPNCIASDTLPSLGLWPLDRVSIHSFQLKRDKLCRYFI